MENSLVTPLQSKYIDNILSEYDKLSKLTAAADIMNNVIGEVIWTWGGKQLQISKANAGKVIYSLLNGLPADIKLRLHGRFVK